MCERFFFPFSLLRIVIKQLNWALSRAMTHPRAAPRQRVRNVVKFSLKMVLSLHHLTTYESSINPRNPAPMAGLSRGSRDKKGILSSLNMVRSTYLLNPVRLFMSVLILSCGFDKSQVLEPMNQFVRPVHFSRGSVISCSLLLSFKRGFRRK